MEYFVGLGLPPREERVFAAIKKELHPEKRLSSPPHITLVSPFWSDNEKELTDKLRTWAEKQTCFDMVLSRTDSFRQARYGTIFLAPETSQSINRLQSSLQKYLLCKRGDGRFRAHLTLAQRVPFDELSRLKSKMNLWGLSLVLPVKGVRLYRRNNRSQWRTLNDFNFLLT